MRTFKWRLRCCWSGILTGIAIGLCCGVQGQPAPASADKDQSDLVDGIVHSRRLSSGVAMGGIGAGTFQLMTDGAISRATYNNNWAQPTGDLSGCFASIFTRSAGSSRAQVLALKSAYGLPTARSVDFEGLFPQALLNYPDADAPVTVNLRAFSPLVPFDLRNSSFPAAAFIIHIANTSPLPVDVSIALSWENTLGVGQGADAKRIADRTGNTVKAVPDNEGFFGMQFANAPAPVTLFADPTLDNARGNMSLLAYPPRKEAVVTTASWNARDARPAWWQRFAAEGLVAGECPEGREGSVHPAGVVAVKLTLKSGDNVEIPFAVSWYTPAFRTPDGGDYGHYYQVAFPNSYRAARTLLDDWRSLLALTEEWQKRLLYSDLPPWLVRRFINSATPLTSNTIHTRDGRFAWLRDTGLSPVNGAAAEGAGEREPSLMASSLLLAFFPQVQARRLDQYLNAQTPEGYFQGDWRDPIRQLGPAPRIVPTAPDGSSGLDLIMDPALGRLTDPGPVIGPQLPQPENFGTASAFVLQAAQYILWTGDRAFLQHAMPGIRRALLNQLRDPNAFVNGFPRSAFTPKEDTLRINRAMNWIAALEAGQKLAEIAEGQALEQSPAVGFLGPVPSALTEIAADRRLRIEAAAALSKARAGIPVLLANRHLIRSEEDTALYTPPVAALFSRPLLIGSWYAEQLQLAPLVPSNVMSDLEREFTASSLVSDPDGFRQGHTGDWCALYSLQGFRYDGAAQMLTLAPQIPGTWHGLSCPVSAPTFWARLDYKPTAHGAVTTLRIDRVISLASESPVRQRSGTIGSSRLTLRALRVSVPNTSATERNAMPVAHVSLGQNPVGFAMTRDPSGDLILTFSTPIGLVAGNRLEVDVR